MNSMEDTHNRKKSKQRYRKVVRVVYHQTTEKQPPLSEINQIMITAAGKGNMDAETARKKLKVGVEEKGHLVCIDGRVGVRFDADRLQRIIKYVAENGMATAENVDGVKKSQLIAELNQIKTNIENADMDIDHLKYRIP
jgi:hypothetical protein